MCMNVYFRYLLCLCVLNSSISEIGAHFCADTVLDLLWRDLMTVAQLIKRSRRRLHYFHKRQYKSIADNYILSVLKM